MKFRNAVFSIFGQETLVIVLAFLTSVIVARWLGPVQLGYFYIILLIPNYAEKFGRLGLIDHAAVYYIKKEKYALGTALTHVGTISLLFSFLPQTFANHHQLQIAHQGMR